MQLEREKIELLAPAGNIEIGIAAIDCGADSLYIGGPSFGAREAASNSLEDIEQLIRYASKFGVKVFLTLNTLLYENELERAERLAHRAWEIGCSALIIQDPQLLNLSLPPIPLFASTQTNIRDVEKAILLEKLGFKRLILARELSLRQIREIRDNTTVELESFVHGALCVSYSGQCYMSEKISGRSANRGECMQPCRFNYDLEDAEGRTIVKEAPLLSMRDLNLSTHINELISAGIRSFKIEGRLKNISYVKNIVRYYRSVLDSVLEEGNNLKRASYGKIYGGFTPNPAATFNRGYTCLYIDAKRGEWNSGEIAKAMGEEVAVIERAELYGNSSTKLYINNLSTIENGDGICFVNRKKSVIGSRVNVADKGFVIINERVDVAAGTRVYRNYNRVFERELENLPKRLLEVTVSITADTNRVVIDAICEDGVKVGLINDGPFDLAKNSNRALENIENQFAKSTGIYKFIVGKIEAGEIPFISLSELNNIRRRVAEILDSARELCRTTSDSNVEFEGLPIDQRSYTVDPQKSDAILMRCKYCIKYQIGRCPKYGYKGKTMEPLYLVNNGRRFRLSFDCDKCEMVIFDKI